jgi:thiosulfate dehydrogenase [quinone] large subunit
MNIQKIVWLKLRFVMSAIFLWAFADKVFGLGFATKSADAWIHGGSPTMGFLKFGTHGPLSLFFQSLAGYVFVDWMFMLGLLFVGMTLLLNRCVLWGAIAGVAMLLLMWLATFPPVNNPLIDEHIVYMLVLSLLAIKSKQGGLSWK